MVSCLQATRKTPPQNFIDIPKIYMLGLISVCDLAAKNLMTIPIFSIWSAIYAPGARMQCIPKVLQISGGNIVLEIVSGEIGVNRPDISLKEQAVRSQRVSIFSCLRDSCRHPAVTSIVPTGEILRVVLQAGEGIDAGRPGADLLPDIVGEGVIIAFCLRLTPEQGI